MLRYVRTGFQKPHSMSPSWVARSLLGYVFDELEYYATLHTSGNSIYLSFAEQVWISASLIDKDTGEGAKRYAAKLEDVPAREKDWHPNSNTQ
ncbi:hypothetical protein IW140_006571, partial [Coemansia sp. RSA 1813]